MQWQSNVICADNITTKISMESDDWLKVKCLILESSGYHAMSNWWKLWTLLSAMMKRATSSFKTFYCLMQCGTHKTTIKLILFREHHGSMFQVITHWPVSAAEQTSRCGLLAGMALHTGDLELHYQIPLVSADTVTAHVQNVNKVFQICHCFQLTFLLWCHSHYCDSWSLENGNSLF